MIWQIFNGDFGDYLNDSLDSDLTMIPKVILKVVKHSSTYLTSNT